MCNNVRTFFALNPHWHRWPAWGGQDDDAATLKMRGQWEENEGEGDGVGRG